MTPYRLLCILAACVPFWYSVLSIFGLPSTLLIAFVLTGVVLMITWGETRGKR